MLSFKMKIKLTQTVVFGLLSLSILVDPEIFSIYYNNLIPIRIFLPLFSIVAIAVFFSKKNLFLLLKDKIFLAFTLLVFLKLISFFYTKDILDYVGLVGFWISLYAFYISIFLLRDKLQIKVLYAYYFLALISIVLSLIKFFAFEFKTNILGFGYEGRHVISHFISDENHYALFLVLLIFLLIYFYLSKKTDKIFTYLSFLFIFLSSFLLIGTLSKNGLGVFLISLVIYVVLFLSNNLSKILLLKLILILTAIFCGMWLGEKHFDFIHNEGFSEKNYNNISVSQSTLTDEEKLTRQEILKTYESRLGESDKNFIRSLDNIGISSASVKAHIALLYVSYELSLERPLFGYGVGSFDDVLLHSNLIGVYSSYDAQAALSGNFPAHSMYGDHLVESGFLGLFTYLLLLLFMGNIYYRNFINSKGMDNKLLSSSFISIFIAFSIFSIFYNLNEEWVWVPLFLGLFLNGKES